MYTVDEMVRIVEGWFHLGNTDDQRAFLCTPREKLTSYHNNIGRTIRNEFKLWETEWKPDIVGGIDCSPHHPDQVSMRVIEGVWDKLHNTNQEDL